MGEHDNEIMPENIVYNLSNKNSWAVFFLNNMNLSIKEVETR